LDMRFHLFRDTIRLRVLIRTDQMTMDAAVNIDSKARAAA
jgi:hypothetical protein